MTERDEDTFAVDGLAIKSAGTHRRAVQRTLALHGPRERRLTDLPEALGLAGAYVGVSNGALIVAGGTNFPNGMPWEGGEKVWRNHIFVLDSPSGTWRGGFELPRPLGYGVSLSVPDGLLCIGGSDEREAMRDVFLLQWSGERIVTRELSDLPEPIAGAGGAVLGDTVYIAGGYASADPAAQPAVRGFWSLNLARPGATWQPLPPWPGIERYFAVCAASDKAIFVLSGMRPYKRADGVVQIECLTDAYRYQLAPHNGDGHSKGSPISHSARVGTWTRMADLPRAHAAAPGPAALVANRWLALVGGGVADDDIVRPMQHHAEFRKTVVAYDMIENRWQQIGTISQSRVATPLVPWGNQFVIASGEVRSGVRSNQVWAYSW